MSHEDRQSASLSTKQSDLLRAVLDRIIPSSERLPGAGEQGVADYINGVVSEYEPLGRLFNYGLEQVAARCESDHARPFGDLTTQQRDNVLKKVEAENALFFEELIRHTYNGYYSDPRVIERLGLDPRPPQPRGYHVEAGDVDKTENVVRRGRIYREV